MSELQQVEQNIASIVSDAKASVSLLNTQSQQLKQILMVAMSSLQGSSQSSYKNMVNCYQETLRKIDLSIKSLTSVIASGEKWLQNHIISHHGVSSIDNASIDNFSNSEPNDYKDPLEPTRSTPRDLVSTQYGFTKNMAGMEVYDSPLEVDKYLYSKQGSAYENFKGTCGLCSIANILRLSGVNIGEKEDSDYAANMQGGIFASKLCSVNPFNPSASGGTTPKQRQQILDYFGISSSVWNVKTDADGKASIDTINEIGKWVSEGRGVIIDVDAGAFYNSPPNYGKGHAVTITSVEKNKYGDITAFYILDSNQGTVKYPTWEIQECMRTFVGMNVTSQIIR